MLLAELILNNDNEFDYKANDLMVMISMRKNVITIFTSVALLGF